MTELIDLHLAALRAEGLSERTVGERGNLLRRLDRELPEGLESVFPEELTEWLGHKGWKAKTRETYWCHIVGFYRWCARGRRRQLTYDPTEELKRPKVRPHLPRAATDDQLHLALDLLDRPALRAVILAAGAGMRASECARARREDFTQSRVIILGKGNKERSVPVRPDVWKEVKDCPPGPLFLDLWGDPVDGKWISQQVARSLDRIGLESLSHHWFRGCYATRLARSGVHMSVIRVLMGHVSIADTQRYVSVDDADLFSAVAAVPALTEPARRGTPAGW